MKTSKFHHKCFAIGLGGYLAILLAVGAKGIPTLGELATNIVRAMPTNHYVVDVNQTSGVVSTNSGAAKASSLALAVQPNAKRNTYQLHYSHEKGFRTEPVSSSGVTTNSVATSTPTSRMRASVNIPNFLKKIRTWPTNSVVEDIWNGTACYKVTASSANASTTFWVDTENNCILRVILFIRGSEYSENTFQYRWDKQHGWLLTNVDMFFIPDGKHIQLQYGSYDFSKP